MIDVSYGVLHYNPDADKVARQAFIDAVESLANNRSDSLTSEVYIIDQGNPLAEIEVGMDLAKQHGFNFVSLEKNIGISRGINWLANVARGNYISLVTSDTLFLPGLDTSLIGSLQDNPDVGMICPASDNSDCPYQLRDFQEGGLVYTITQELTIQFWPRRTFETIGFFDERWKACYENVDYALRIFLGGGFAAISHDAFCPHDYHMCMRNGSRDNAYDDYIGMSDGFNPEVLKAIWYNKWPGLVPTAEVLPEKRLTEIRAHLNTIYGHNLYMPYVQEVGY